MRLGLAFVPRAGTPFDPVGHLWIVFSGPFAGERGQSVLAASVTSTTGDPSDDPSCLLAPGDHPFVIHPSFVSYLRAREFLVAGLPVALSSGFLLGQPDASAHLVTRIQRGALSSVRLRRGFRALLVAQGVQP